VARLGHAETVDRIVVATTTEADDDRIEAEARIHGAVYLQKPLVNPTLVETVARLIAERSAAGAT